MEGQVPNLGGKKKHCPRDGYMNEGSELYFCNANLLFHLDSLVCTVRGDIQRVPLDLVEHLFGISLKHRGD